MIRCPACDRQHRAGTLFCKECGTYLPTGSALRTDPLSEKERTAPQANPWSDGAGDIPESKEPATIRVTIPETGRQVQLPAASDILIGRLDAASQVFPQLDLTADGGLEAGVSRRHAKVHHQDGRFLVEDLGSANGTYVNGRRLTSYLPHPIRSGDELRLGRLVLIVEFDGASV